MRDWLARAAVVLLMVGGCYRIPASVRTFAGELPARADGQYATLDEPVRKQLVMKDALLACRIDLEDGKKEAESAACRCSGSTSEDWVADCRDWLGSHAPAQTPVAAETEN